MGCGVILAVNDTRTHIRAQTPKSQLKILPRAPPQPQQNTFSNQTQKKGELKIEDELTHRNLQDQSAKNSKHQQNSAKKKLIDLPLEKQKISTDQIPKKNEKTNENAKVDNIPQKVLPSLGSSLKKKESQSTLQDKNETIMPKKVEKIEHENIKCLDKVAETYQKNEIEQKPQCKDNSENTAKRITNLQSKVSIKEPLEEIKQTLKAPTPQKSHRSVVPKGEISKAKNNKNSSKNLIPVESLFFDSSLLKGLPEKKQQTSKVDKGNEQTENKLVRRISSKQIKKGGQKSTNVLNLTEILPQNSQQNENLTNFPSKSSEKQIIIPTSHNMSRKTIKRVTKNEKETEHIRQLNKRLAQQNKKKVTVQSNRLKKVYQL